MIAPNDTIGTYAAKYLLVRDVCQLHADTVCARVAAFESWAGSPVLLRGLTPDLVNGWLAFLKTSGVSPWTVRGGRSNILAVWNAAADERLCDYPVARQIRRITPPQQITEGWEKPEVERLLAHCKTLSGILPNGISRGAYY